jgi:hypothetical protein
MIDEIRQKFQFFFPRENFSTSAINEGLEKGTLLQGGEALLLYLQTALVDEKILEIELDGLPTVYFSRLKDDATFLQDDASDSVGEETSRLSDGSYLLAMSHLITLPLEPGLGNLSLRQSVSIVIRMFTSNHAIEMATRFRELATIDDLPVLKLEYPELARIVYDVREFRAKVIDSFDFTVAIEDAEGEPILETRPVNISIRGISIGMKKKEQKLFRLSEVYTLKFYINDELMLRIDSSVRHLAKIRKRLTIEYVCGMEFDFRSKTQTSVVESIVATVQRAHLKELAEKSDATGLRLVT